MTDTGTEPVAGKGRDGCYATVYLERTLVLDPELNECRHWGNVMKQWLPRSWESGSRYTRGRGRESAGSSSLGYLSVPESSRAFRMCMPQLTLLHAARDCGVRAMEDETPNSRCETYSS